MAQNKTQKTTAVVTDFLNSIENEKKRTDCFRLVEMMKRISGEEPAMWGETIVGFGDYHYKYSSGRAGDWFKLGFSPRKQALTVYISQGFADKEEMLARLGKYKTGMVCLYVKTLEDIDINVLEELLVAGNNV